jgi:hypothetical protein
VAVGVLVGVDVLVGVGVAVLVAVWVGEPVGVSVAATTVVSVGVGVCVGVLVAAAVDVAGGVGRGPSPGISMCAFCVACSGEKPPQTIRGFPPPVWVTLSCTVVVPVTDGSTPSLMNRDSVDKEGGWALEVKVAEATTSPPIRMSARTLVDSTGSRLAT